MAATAVWLIILTIIVCASVPAIMIWLTSTPKMLAGIEYVAGNFMLFPAFGQLI